jgi:hypothetical protein
LFGRFELGQQWDAEETNKRNEFSKRFKKINDHSKLGEEYGLYSFKHTFITKLYNSFRENMSQHEAKSNLMPISLKYTFQFARNDVVYGLLRLSSN